ncbi:acetyl-CoA carboxylase [uncultured Pseudonocardia sp.]|uniref:acetyl-CoA carboxylase n=1 Tax=uncultured Pseudonocardia sp. TaxID=211455 RepID=UPI00260BF8E7|nr:acetyl-CoA carboxylase [uncultured Pseudonocardia sp.]
MSAGAFLAHDGANGRDHSGPGGGNDLDAICHSIAAIVASGATRPSRVRVSAGSASVEIEWPAGRPTPGPVPGPDHAEPEPVPDAGLHELCAPLVGTFYRRPDPAAAPFVVVGDQVVVGQQVGIVEAMKLMNSIEADRAGRVAEILVDDTEGVDYGQVLLRIEPLDGA